MSMKDENLPEEENGPYTMSDIETLAFLESLQMTGLREMTKDGIDTSEDSINKILALSKEIANNIHRKTATKSRHVTESTKAGSMADMAEMAKKIQLASSEAKLKITPEEKQLDIDPKFIPDDIVPGQLEQEINKPTYEEIMNTPEED